MDISRELSRRSDIKIKNVYRFIAAVIICELAGVIGSVFTSTAMPDWYMELEKPRFTPPVWVFGPVWVLIYFLMGISLFIVWKRGIKGAQVFKPVFYFSLQLILNVFWTFTFFGLRSPHAALIVIIALWIMILLTIIQFFHIKKVAAYLLMPYILWVSFAVLINYSIWSLNYR